VPINWCSSVPKNHLDIRVIFQYRSPLIFPFHATVNSAVADTTLKMNVRVLTGHYMTIKLASIILLFSNEVKS